MFSSSVYNRLPPEIVLRILSFAAGSSTASCLTLCLVSSWVRRVALPHLLRTVILRNGDDAQSFADYIRSKPALSCSPNSVPLAQMVHSLWLPRGQGDRMAHHILSNCSNLTNLAVTSETFLFLAAISSFEPSVQLRLRDLRLTILTPGDVFSIMFARPSAHGSRLCDMVTHVWLIETSVYGLDRQIQHFPRLTHLAIPYDCIATSPRFSVDSFSLLGQVLTSRTLIALVLVMYPDETAYNQYGPHLEAWVRRTRTIDRRVFLVTSSRDHMQADWKDEADGGESIWDKAVRHTYLWEAAPQVLRRKPALGNLSSMSRSQSAEYDMEL